MSKRERAFNSDDSYPAQGVYTVHQLVDGSGDDKGFWDEDFSSFESGPSFQRLTSHMIDHVSEPSHDTHWQFQDVDHEHLTADYRVYGFGTPDNALYVCDEAVDIGSFAYAKTARSICESAAMQTPFRLDSYHVNELLPIYYSSALPRRVLISQDPFDTDFSIWYTVVDLFQLKGLLKSLFSSRMPSAYRASPYQGRPDLTARQLADTHLGVTFGMIPTIQDIQDTLRLLQTWRDPYDHMDRLLAKRYRKHSNVDLSPIRPDLFPPAQKHNTVVSVSGTISSYPVNVEIDKTTTASWHGLTLYGFSCPEFQGWLARLAQICDSFGVFDPSAVWDVLPFSFIVDWFYGISTWLHKNKPKFFPATVVVYDYLETIKVVTNVTYTATWIRPLLGASNPPFNEAVLKPHVIGTERYTTYIRRVFNPGNNVVVSQPLLPKKSFVRVNRIGIASSLAIQHLLR
jgi:hypothetical protein